MASRYSKSESFLERALKSIPLGSQTFSKSITQFPRGVSPFFIQRADGCRVWDIDGNEYIDFINSLGAITLGYNDPDVTKAVKAQLEEGVIFSLAHPIETYVAEKLRECVPSAEKVRYGKNGSDATAAAVRLGRAFTKRDRVAVCGYHGWQDWYIGSTLRDLGVPKATKELTHTFAYNNLDSLHALFKKHPDEFAIVIMEPMSGIRPEPGFLQGVKELAHQHGALLAFDETVTGFRFANGGAQELFGVTPDLSTFGKGMANGYPIAAVTGRSDVMKLMEDIFFSFTFGGEALSLAASLATMQKLQREPVLATMRARGERIVSGVQGLIAKHGIGDFLSIVGEPVMTFLVFKDTPNYSQWHTKTLFLQEVLERGILTLGAHTMSYAHGDKEVDRLLAVYDEVYGILAQAVHGGKMESLLRCQPLTPLFKLRQ